MSSDSESLKDYFARLTARVHEGEGITERLIQLQAIAESGKHHLQRLMLAKKRYDRAVRDGNSVAQSYEQEVMLTLLYETADTVYIALGVIDFDELGLRSSDDGRGIVGDAASDVVHTLITLEGLCSSIITLEEELGLKVDFKTAQDEKEGITFSEHRHWQDYVPESAEKSFFAYFKRAQENIQDHLGRSPSFWEQQTLKRYLERKGYKNLLLVVERLTKASL